MNATQLENGTQVSLSETSRGNVRVRSGVVVETSGERTRVLWNASGYCKSKRTWIATNRLAVKA